MANKLKSVNAQEFIRLLRGTFPGGIDRAIKNEDSIYLQMRYFVEFTQSAIDRGDFVLVDRCFTFAEQMLARADEEVFNALCVGFLEHIAFSGTNGTKAFAMLGPIGKKNWHELEDHWRSLKKK